MIIIQAKKSQIFGVKAPMPLGMVKIRLKRFLDRNKLRNIIALNNQNAITKHY
jgi:hypothetical protein